MNLTMCYLAFVVAFFLSGIMIAIILAFLSRMFEWDNWIWLKLNKGLDIYFDWAIKKLLR